MLVAVAATLQPTQARFKQFQPVLAGGTRSLANSRQGIHAVTRLHSEGDTAADIRALSSAVRRLSNEDPSDITDEGSLLS
jgi:hypothetical protein